MLLDFERRRLDEIGREIASDFRELRREARRRNLPDAGARYAYQFGQLKMICAWLHDQLVEEAAEVDRFRNPMLEIARATARAAAVAAVDDDAGLFLGGGV